MITSSSSKESISKKAEVWFLTSELEGERAGAFRQERWCRIFFGLNARISVFNIKGALSLTETHFEREQEFDIFRTGALARVKARASIREGLFVGLLRALKHSLLAELFLPNLVALFFRAKRRID